MKIDAGKLDRKLELITLTTVTDDLGQEKSTETVSASVWAQRLDMRTQDAARAGGKETFTFARYLIRWRTIDTSQRVRIDGKTYDIVAMDEPPGSRRSAIILTLEERTR